MTDVVESGIDGRSEGLPLDPFSFIPGVASRIVGLGGNAPGRDPAYAFHTSYVQVAPGRATFNVRFNGLTARRGTLVVRVHMLPEAGAHARLVNSDRITFSRLIALGGEVSISFEAFRNVSYAVYAMIPDETDARAEGLTVLIDRPDDGIQVEQEVAEARSTVFGAKALMPVARLVTLAQPTLADPVSQLCTASQVQEAAYASWASRLRQDVHKDRKQWEDIYILQVLDRYGLLRPGALGISFGVGTGPLTSVMASMGVEVVTTDQRAEIDEGVQEGISGLSDSSAIDHAGPEKLVSLRPIDLAEIPTDLVNFDFAWSAGVQEHLGSVDAGLNFVEQSLNCLRPGGLAVHTMALSLASDEGMIDAADPVLFRRRDMERLALSLISRGHEVAQLNWKSDDLLTDPAVDLSLYGRDEHATAMSGRYRIGFFGIIVRKAMSPL